MNEQERIERLEKLYEGLYQEIELLSIYIPKLTDILIKYFSASGKLRYEIFGDFNSIQSVLKNILDDLQGHYKDHFSEIKKKVSEPRKGRHYKY